MSTLPRTADAAPTDAPLAARAAHDAPATRPSALRLNLATIAVLISRDLRRFFRQRSRVVGALVQPIIFWLVIGGGLGGSFRMPSEAPGADGIGYLQYFFPGIVVLVVLFTSIFTTMSVIEDRHKGFLQAVLVAPASRAALVLGKTLGGVAIAVAQAGAFLALAPLAGYPLSAVDWPLAAAVLVLGAVGLSAAGFAIAWWLDSTQGYHVIMSVLLIPLWILSGAMFPPSGAAPLLRAIMRANPMAYCVSGLRRALHGGLGDSALGGTLPGSSAGLDLLVTGLLAAAAVALAARLCARTGAR